MSTMPWTTASPRSCTLAKPVTSSARQALIEKGASLNAVSKDNFTMLMAASYGGLVSVIKQVLPLSEIDAAVVNTHETQAGYTALMYASEHGHDACVQALIEAGARKDLETKKGSTALSLARSNGHTALCALLENSGID